MTTNKETDSTKPETQERAELVNRLRNLAGQPYRFDGHNEIGVALLQAAIMLEADGKAGGEVAHYARGRTDGFQEATIDWLKYDNQLRFIQRCLEGDAPKSDRDDAAKMVRSIRVSARPQQAAQVAQPLTPIQVRDGIADWLEANMAHREFWTPEVVELIRSIEINGIGKDQAS